MNRIQKSRLTIILSILILLGGAAGLILFALKQNINLFYTPTELLQAHVSPEQSIRIGGYVKNHSVIYDNSGQFVTFVVTDRTHDLTVTYHGVLPNLFREGQTVVVTGTFAGNHLEANQVLAKHDEKYMPKVLAQKLGVSKT